MKKIGVVSYNIYCNFTNYGSALQSWAMQRAIDKISNKRWKAVMVDYCPDILKDKNPLDPFKNMWDRSDSAKAMCDRSMPAIKVNYQKFNDFYQKKFTKTSNCYTSANFNQICEMEEIDAFVCGSDTIFCIDEFGFDDGYYANYECMRKGNSVAYAASFGDVHFDEETYAILDERISNFSAIGLRENAMLGYVEEKTNVPVEKVIDPTLLLTVDEYEEIVADQQISEKYLLLYSRRYNPKMEAFAEKMAQENGWKIIEISLRATNDQKGHIMRYDAGVEEFLSLVKHAEFVVTNSFHGMIFAVQFCREFVVFSREQCDNKIEEILDLFGIKDRMLLEEKLREFQAIKYEEVHERISTAREKALQFLNFELEGLL